jgi:hypothetical protein
VSRVADVYDTDADTDVAAKARRLALIASFSREIFGTRDGGETWASMPLLGPVKDIYSVAYG